MKAIIGIRREDLDKVAEQRVAIAPAEAQQLIELGNQVLIQGRTHPQTGESKRAYPDDAYATLGVSIQEDLDQADIIFGLKEIGISHIRPEKVYLCFSHTHKGQLKNRKLLRKLAEGQNTLIDYELMVDAKKRRLLTAFTYFAGYAGMTDSLWAFGQRMRALGIDHPLSTLPQSIDIPGLDKTKALIKDIGKHIAQAGTPASLPPFICCILGAGKTSVGSQEMFKLLPAEEIRLEDLQTVYEQGSRRKVYQLVLDIPDMYRLKVDSPYHGQDLSYEKLFSLYLKEPDNFTSNLDMVFPYVSILMNCILWSPRYPRLLTRDDTAHWFQQHQNLQVIGDITCDPEGAIEFSHETWINDPIFTYDPLRRSETNTFDSEGIVVMAVTNLPCAFPVDASAQFSKELAPLLPNIAQGDFQADSLQQAGLSPELSQATIMWKGRFTPDYRYMEAYLRE